MIIKLLLIYLIVRKYDKIKLALMIIITVLVIFLK